MKKEIEFIPAELIKLPFNYTTIKLLIFLFKKIGYKDPYFLPSNKYLSDKLNISVRTIINSIKELRENEILSTNETNGISLKFSNFTFDRKWRYNNNKNNQIFKEMYKEKFPENFFIDMDIFFNETLTPAELVAYILISNVYCYYDEKTGYFITKKDCHMTFDGICTTFEMKKRFSDNFSKLKNKKFITYKVVSSGKEAKKIFGLKVFGIVTKQFITNGETITDKDGTFTTKEKVIQPRRIIKQAEKQIEETIEQEIEETYTPSEEDRKEVDKLLSNLRSCFKLEYERDIKYYRLDDQIIWLRKRQN